MLDDLTCLLQLRERLQPQEVHLDQSGALDDMAIILRYRTLQVGKIWVVGSRDGHPIADGVAANDKTTSVNTNPSNRTLKLLGILNGIAFLRIDRHLCIAQLRRTLDGIGQIHLHAVWQTLRNGLFEGIRPVERQFLHTRHIGNGVLRGHTSISDDVGTVLVAILIHHPSKHLTSSVIIEVGVDIRKVHTVRVKETLKQQVVFQRVDPGYAQAISHHRSCGRATARTYPYAQIVTCSIDKVLHDKEITWEAHCLHGVKLEVDVLTHIHGHRVAIEFLGSLVCQFSQIVGFKLNAVKFVDTAQQFYLLASFLGWQGILAILVGRKLLIDFLVRVPLAPQFLCAKTLRNREKRHDGSMVDAIDLHLI